MKKTAKGEPGYVQYEKKKRTIITVIMFAIPLTIFFTGLAGGHRDCLLFRYDHFWEDTPSPS